MLGKKAGHNKTLNRLATKPFQTLAAAMSSDIVLLENIFFHYFLSRKGANYS